MKNDIQYSFAKGCITDENAMILSNLLFAKYANNPIANGSEEQFKNKLYAIVFQFGPNWQKRLEVQKKIIELSDDDLIIGQKSIANRANNIGLDGTKAELEELNQVDDQTVNTIKRSKVEAYASLLSMLDDDFTELFIDRFKVLFNQFAMAQEVITFVTEEE